MMTHVTWRHEPRLTTSLFGDIHQWNIRKYSSARQTVYLCLQEMPAIEKIINMIFRTENLDRKSGPRIKNGNLNPEIWTGNLNPEIWTKNLDRNLDRKFRSKKSFQSFDRKSEIFLKWLLIRIELMFDVRQVKSSSLDGEKICSPKNSVFDIFVVSTFHLFLFYFFVKIVFCFNSFYLIFD